MEYRHRPINEQAVFEILEKYNLEESKIAEDIIKLPEYNEKYSDWKEFPWLNQEILEESKRRKERKQSR